MHCPHCGHAARIPDPRFCMECGKPFPGVAQAPARVAPLDVTVEHRPSFAVATVKLRAGQTLRAEAGAMVAMSPHVQVEGKMEGGFFGALKRAAASESFFQTTFTAAGAPGEVLLAPAAPGDITSVEVGGRSFIVQAASYLASDVALTMDTKLSGFRGFFSGEGLFFLQVSGEGTLLLSSYGAIVKKQLAPGERYVVDTEHIVAFESSVRYQLRKASQAGWWASMKSGEGVVCEYEGPGELLLQTRNLRAFALTLWPLLPKPQPTTVKIG